MEFDNLKIYFSTRTPFPSEVNRSLKAQEIFLFPRFKNLVLIFSPMEIELKNLFSYQFYHKYEELVLLKLIILIQKLTSMKQENLTISLTQSSRGVEFI